MIDNYTIPFLALIAILFGIIHEEKLIAFEDKLCNVIAELWDIIADRIGYMAAKVFIWFRRLKKGN